MVELLDFAKANMDKLIEPFGKLDVVPFYSIVARGLEKYLGRREIASRIWMSQGNLPFLLKRGSRLKPLLAHELSSNVTVQFLKTRSKFDKLSEVGEGITDSERLIWEYFLPGKLADFFYATNGEGSGKHIDRIFLDIDRGKGISAKTACEATSSLITKLKEDEQLAQLTEKVEPFVYWTGRSFHVMLFLQHEMPKEFYDTYFQFSKHRPEASLTGRWASQVGNELKVRVIGGHEKMENAITIDPSQTPPGKLCRVPLGSLHMKDGQTTDGVSIPLSEKMLQRPDLTDDLVAYGPREVLRDLDELVDRFPRQFR